MNVIIVIIQFFAIFWGCLAALLSILLFIRLNWPAEISWFLKLYASALSPFFIIIGALSAITGVALGSSFLTVIGGYDVLVFSAHIFLVTRPPDSSSNFEKAFGLNWKDKIEPELKKNFLPRRAVLSLPAVSKPMVDRNIPFATIPGTGRQLLCDIWQPDKNTARSGLAFIYIHGGAWYLLDKDVGTRPLFAHLTAQGHVIMDIAYRLAPETDMMGMINDVKRAIAWLKENANIYRINPDKIAIGGGSAGAHLALLAAYTGDDPQFTPEELKGTNLKVCSVVSLYAPSDLKSLYYHTNQNCTTSILGRSKKVVRKQFPQWMIKKMGKNYYRLGMNKGLQDGLAFAAFLGGHPDQCPQIYARFSPGTHIHSNCPPTLLIHGEHDVMAPVNCTCFLHTRLKEQGVPVVMHILPQTEHAFDLQLPKYSPSAHNAIFDIDCFLRLVLMK